MIIDTSAVIAIAYQEPEARAFLEMILAADVARFSAASYVELTLVIESQRGVEEGRQADALVRRAGLVIEPVTLEHGELARQAFRDYGKGRHKAGLNYGDCFSYALAKASDEPLLFKGNDFALTDIKSAAPV